MIYVTTKVIDELPPDAVTGTSDGVTFIKTDYEMNLREATELSPLSITSERSFRKEYKQALLLALLFYVIGVIALQYNRRKFGFLNSKEINTLSLGYVGAITFILYKLFRFKTEEFS